CGFTFVFVTESVVGNPRDTRSDVARVCVFPAASVVTTLLTLQVPFSLVLGNVTAADPVTEVLGVKVAVAVCVPVVDGLTKVAWMFATPERSSVAETLTVTVAGAEVTSMEVGVKLNAVRFGGVVSLVEVTVSVVANPLAIRSAVPSTDVFPA